MPLTYSARTRKEKGIKTHSSFPSSMWDKVREERKKYKRKDLVAITIIPIIPH